MEFLNTLFNFLIKPIWKFIKKQWIGLSVGIVFSIIIFIIFFLPIIIKHFENGTFVNKITIKKGTNVLVAANELNIEFSDRTFYIKYNTKDTIHIYPEFILSTRQGNSNNIQIRNVQDGQKLSYDGKYYIYIIEFLDFEFISKDTIVTVDVYRREYPGNLRP